MHFRGARPLASHWATKTRLAPDSAGWHTRRLRPCPVVWSLSVGVHRNLLVNQNLLYLVFKWGLNTKHSGSGRAPQGFFVHRRGAPKRPPIRAFAGIPAAYPRAIHRLSTISSTTFAADERCHQRCKFATAGWCCSAANWAAGRTGAPRRWRRYGRRQAATPGRAR